MNTEGAIDEVLSQFVHDYPDTNVTDPYLAEMSSFDRLETEYYKYGSLTIGYDFDGTVHNYHKIPGATHARVIALLRDLRDIGCKCICWTCYPDLVYVLEHCKANDIPCDGVNKDGIPLPWTSRKPFYSALLDDRAGLGEVYLDLSLLVYKVKMNKEDESRDDTRSDNRISDSEQRGEI